MSEPAPGRSAPDTRADGGLTVTGVPIRGHRPVRPVLVMTVFCLGLFMTLLDITIVNIAIPDLVTDLNATLETVLWVGSAYSLTYTVLLIQRGPAFAATGIMSGLGVLLGPTLGGFIVTNVGWRWIFFLNIPIGVLAIALAFVFMPDVRPGVRHRLDVPGVLLLTAGLLGVVFGLIEGQRYDWGTIAGVVTIPMVIVTGAVLLGLFLWRQVRTQDAEPLLPFAVFTDRTFTVMTLVLLAMGFAIVGVFLPMTIYYQSVLGLTAVAAGLVIGTQSLAMMITSGVVGGLSDSGGVSMKWVLMGGLLLFAAGMTYVVSVAEPDSGQWAFVPGLVAAGIGLGCVWVPVFGLATRDMPPSRAGVGAGVLDTLQEFGSVLATAILGALLANRLTAALRTQAQAAAAGLPEQARAPFVDGMAAAGSGGIEVGAGQAAGMTLPDGVPAAVAAQIHAAAQHAFAAAFTDAMIPTMVVTIAVILLAAGAVLFVRSKPPATAAAPVPDAGEPAEDAGGMVETFPGPTDGSRLASQPVTSG